MQRLLLPALATSLCLLSGHSFADEPQATSQEQVRLKFDWPAGLTAQVSAKKTKSRTKDDAEPTVKVVELHYTMTTARKGEDLVVAYENVGIDMQDGKQLSDDERDLAALLTQGVMPTYLISKDGDFLALENFEGFVQALRRLLEKSMPDPEARKRVQPALDQFLSAPMLTAQAKGEWDWMVGTWSGGDHGFDMGDEYVARSQVAVPLLGNQVVEMETHFVFKRSLPCERGGVVRDCVQLLALNQPDAAKLAPALDRFLSRLAPNAQSKIDNIGLETNIELIVETATLLPHYFNLRKDITVGGVEAGRKTTTVGIDETELEFSYPAGK